MKYTKIGEKVYQEISKDERENRLYKLREDNDRIESEIEIKEKEIAEGV